MKGAGGGRLQTLHRDVYLTRVMQGLLNCSHQLGAGVKVWKLDLGSDFLMLALHQSC